MLGASVRGGCSRAHPKTNIEVRHLEAHAARQSELDVINARQYEQLPPIGKPAGPRAIRSRPAASDIPDSPITPDIGTPKYKPTLPVWRSTPVNSTPPSGWAKTIDDTADDQYSLGVACFEQKDFEGAVDWFRKAADRGAASAQYALGGCYDEGIGVSQNSQEAVDWYRKAADQGHAKAQGNLGFCYSRGVGVSRNNHEAAKWYRKAAEQGVARAQGNLGICYYNGEGVAQDYQEAAKWFRLAAEQGNDMAQAVLGSCYYNGRGVPQDPVSAHCFFSLSARAGNNTEAASSLAEIEKKLTPQQIAAAQEMARQWAKAHPAK